MGSATSLGFPYPASSDPPNAGGDIQALAAAVDQWLTGPAWITLTLASGVVPNTGAGSGVNGTYLPAYRVWTNGLVEYRGCVQPSSGGFASSATLFPVPAAAMPAAIVRFPVSGNVGSGVAENARFELTPSDGLFRVWAGSGDYTFVSLDNVRYYKT